MNSILFTDLDFLRELTTISVALRIVLAMLAGGALGMEREQKKRPAGFRTYILVCVGSCLVMLTNMYMVAMYGSGDPARLPAQVVTGMGFLGAGTILVTKNNQVKGLTTAAGLWGSACIGLAFGSGFYLGGLMAFAVFFLSMRVFSGVDKRIGKKSSRMMIYVEASSVGGFRNMLSEMRGKGFRIETSNIERNLYGDEGGLSALLELKLTDIKEHEEVLEMIRGCDNIAFVEEM